MRDATQFHTLAESKRYLLGHVYEEVQAFDKFNTQTLVVGEHYGDPTIGLISPNELWFISGGEGVQCYSVTDKKIHTFFRQHFPPLSPESQAPYWSVRTMAWVAPHKVRIEIDPLSEFFSTWELDLETLSLSRTTA